MTKKLPATASPDDANLAEVRRLGSETLDRWQRIAGDDPDGMMWARRIAETLDAEALTSLIADYRRLANDARLDSIDKAEARQRAKALASIRRKRPGKK